MAKQKDYDEMYEFRIQFHHRGLTSLTIVILLLYLINLPLKCLNLLRQRRTRWEIVRVERWNRWADRWECVEELSKEEIDLVS